jgi:hypothetical protein
MVWFIFIFLATTGVASAATDVVTVLTGEKIVGEIKKVEKDVLTIDDRYRINFRFDLDFNLPGDWYFRSGVFDNFDSKPPAGLSKNDFGWSNSFGLKF